VSARTTETTASTEPTRGRAAKKILVVSFSQSGQLDRIVASLLAPLRERTGVEIVEERLAPAVPFRFPWSVYEFLDVFPEAFREIPCALAPLKVTASERYDLVILAYQVWYLAPSIPTSSFLQSREAALLLDGTPVLTIVGCRNMWFRAHALVKNRVRAAKGRLVGHIVLTDRAYHLVSVVTILYWMLTGRKDRLLGLFPRPGVSDEDIARSSAYGTVVADALSAPVFPDIQDELNRRSACRVVPHLMWLEDRAARPFAIWSKLILKKGGHGDPRRKWAVRIFGWYLASAVALFSPLAFLAFYLALPFRRSAVERRVEEAYLN
jgi:hypothetical protein